MFPEDLMFTSNKQEKIFEMRTEYPFIIRHVYPQRGKSIIAPWHWHEELELIYVQKGAVTYHTPQMSLQIQEKNGLFTNSNVLHQVLSSEPDSEIFYEVFMFRRNFLAEEGSYLDKKYVSPLLQSNAASSLLLSRSDPARKKILEQLLELSELNQTRPFGYDMKSRNLMSDIWLHMAEISNTAPDPISTSSALREDRLKKMLLYIQEHYMDELSLADIANAANISEREALRCFQGGIHTSPFVYLGEYRVQTACGLLRNTSDKITDIALRCGFASSSYFGKVFRRHIGCTPFEYRNRYYQ